MQHCSLKACKGTSILSKSYKLVYELVDWDRYVANVRGYLTSL